jgi:hypothetical protein
MKKELDEALVAKYPKIFKYRHAPMTHTAMCWGFDCGDGWYNIVDVLCSNIQHHVDNKRKDRAKALRFNRALKRALAGDVRPLQMHFSFGDCAEPTKFGIEYADKAIEKAKYKEVPPIMPYITASQVKEKFGGLRFYTNVYTDEISGMMSMAEGMSYRTCEVCGNPGRANNYGWISTLCDTHRLERGEELPQNEVQEQYPAED